MNEFEEALKGHKLVYLNGPTFLLWFMKDNKLESRAMACSTYPIEWFIKLLKERNGIIQVFIYRDQQGSSYWKYTSPIIINGETDIERKVVRGWIQYENDRYSLKLKGKQKQKINLNNL